MVAASRYIHLHTMGSREDGARVGKKLVTWLDGLLQDEVIRGYEVVIVKSFETAERRILWGDFEEVVHQRYPFLYVAIQELDEGHQHLGKMEELGFALIRKVKPLSSPDAQFDPERDGANGS